MKRHIHFFLLLIFCWATCFAEPIDVEQARGKAAKFLQKQHPDAKLEDNTPVYSPKRKRMVKGQVPIELPIYYVFNTEDSQGYVIVSADDRTDAILGYATAGRFDADEIPENVKAWMNSYAEQIAALDKYSQETTVNSQETTDKRQQTLSRPVIEPLLTTRWNQDAPYNHSCPLQGSSRTYTGCTATAMAQVMKYHEWPKEQTLSIPAYTTATAQIYVPELEPTTFKWGEMLDDYTHIDYAPAVAELMFYCGQALQSDFTRYSTSAYLVDAPGLLSKYFGYDPNMEFLYQANYSISDWEDIIYNELQAQRPVLHAGTSLGAGHAFVCDGYDGQGMFHFNWGWGGMYDGYYKLSLLTPGTDGIGAGTEDGFSANQRIIVGIQPPIGQTVPLKAFTSLDLQQSGTNLYCNFQNPNTIFASMNVGFALVSETGEIQRMLKDCGKMGLKGYNLEKNWAGLYLGEYGEVDLSPGTHRIAGICQLEDGTWVIGGSKQTYFEVTVGVNNTLEEVILHPILKKEITAFECISGKVVGTKQKVRITVENQGDDMNGMLYFYASQVDRMDTPLTRVPLLLHGGEVATYDVHFFAENVGKYYLYLSENDDRVNYVAKCEVEVIPAPTQPAQLDLVDCTISTDCTSAVVQVRNNSDEPYHREIVAQLFEELYDDGNYYYIKRMDQAGEIAPNTTKAFTFPLDGIKPNRNYYLYIGHYHLHTDEFTTQLGTSKYFSLSATGVDPVSCTATPAHGIIYRIDGTRTSDLNRPGVYIMDRKKIMVR